MPDTGTKHLVGKEKRTNEARGPCEQFLPCLAPVLPVLLERGWRNLGKPEDAL